MELWLSMLLFLLLIIMQIKLVLYVCKGKLCFIVFQNVADFVIVLHCCNDSLIMTVHNV